MFFVKPYVNQIHRLLIKNKKTVAVAESCTGGLLSNLLTQTPGSSRYFTLGIVAYSNAAKASVLKVPARLIMKKSAVSKEVAKNLASSVRRLAKTDYGIGITGIAGPKADPSKKPVGLVFIAIDSKNKKGCYRFLLKGGRALIRRTSALKALVLLNNYLK